MRAALRARVSRQGHNNQAQTDGLCAEAAQQHCTARLLAGMHT